MGGLCEGGHVVHGTRAVVHMGQHQHRHLIRQRTANVFGLDQRQLEATRLANGFGDVEVGREVAALADDGFALRVILCADLPSR